MPKQTTKSSILSQLGNAGKKAYDAHKNDETTFSNAGELPAGIEFGVAELVDLKFDLYKSGDMKGKPYFLAAGVVVSPKKHDGNKIEGLRTQIGPEPLCDTPNRTRATLADHWSWIENELRKLGLDTSETPYEEIEDACAALVEAAPRFRFRTWKSKPATEGPYKDQEPRTQHTWNGLLTDEDQTEDGEEGGDEDLDDDTAAAGGEVVEEEEATEEGEEADLEALAKAADEDQDQDAAAQLEAKALEAGIEQDTIDNAESWAAVVEMLTAEGEEEGAEEEEEEVQEEEEEEYIPSKGDVVSHKPKGAKKAKEYEVTVVLTKSKTAHLKNLEDGKVIKGVAWDQLIAAT